MHQTAQRHLLASAHCRIDNKRASFKSEANKPMTTAAVAVRAGAKPCPYKPGHQVELLHLQAEADALILKLQMADQTQTAGS